MLAVMYCEREGSCVRFEGSCVRFEERRRRDARFAGDRAEEESGGARSAAVMKRTPEEQAE